MPHKTFSGFDAANCQPQNHFPILFLYFQCFKVSQKSRRCRSCKPFPHQSESGPNQFAKYVQHNSIQCSRDFMFYVHIPKKKSIYKHTICLNIPCSKKRLVLVLDHGLLHHNTEEEMVRCLRHKSYIFCLSAGYTGQTCMSNSKNKNIHITNVILRSLAASI